jgi:hypothetical protein
VKKRCEHLVAGSWHVATQEARELVGLPAGRRYGWGDQLRAEASGPVSKWMWPGLAALVGAGVLIGDWWLILGAIAALLFFTYQAATLVRALGAGELVVTRSHELAEGERDGEPTRRAVYEVDGTTREVDVDCPHCADALRAGHTLELAVLVDRTDPREAWLAGFREA